MGNLRRVDDVDKVTNQYGVQGGRVLRSKIGGLEQSLDEQVERYKEANPDSDPNEVQKIREMFIIFDQDLSGDLNVDEMVAMYEKLEKPKNRLQVQKEIQKYDVSKSGTLDLFEFLEMSLGAGANPFLKTLLFFKQLELKNAEEAARARDPKAAFMAERKR